MDTAAVPTVTAAALPVGLAVWMVIASQKAESVVLLANTAIPVPPVYLWRECKSVLL
jgi:hypothetical protein